MKVAALKFRLVAAAAIVLIVYATISYDVITRRFGFVDPALYLTGITIVILSSGYIVGSLPLPWRLGWAVTAPEIGSIVGYAIVTLAFELNHISPRAQLGSAWDTLLVAIVIPFFQARIWIISMGLLIACAIDFVWRRANERGQSHL